MKSQESRRVIPAGLIDQGFASLATFVIGLYALGLGKDFVSAAGAWALFFGAFRIATVIPTWLMFVPCEVASLTSPRRQRAGVLTQSLRLGAGPSALAAPLVLLPILWINFFWRPDEQPDTSLLVAFALAGVVAAFLSPIQDHVRRVLHLSDASWRAALVSGIQLGAIVVAVLVIQSTSISPVWIPFGSLAVANAISLPLALIMARGLHPEPFNEKLDARELIGSGRHLSTHELLFAVGDFAVLGTISVLTSADVTGYAEAARQAARPLAVLAEGLRAVLAPRSMESASAGNTGSARRISRTFALAIVGSGVLYIAVAGHPWAGNPLTYISQLDGAWVVAGLVAVTSLSNIFQGLLESPRSELIGGGRQETLARVEWRATFARLVGGASAMWTGAFAFPLSLMALQWIRWRGYRSDLIGVYADPTTRLREGTPRVIAFAYACEPARGSEHAAGWGLVQTLGESAEVTCLVSPDNIPAIRAWEEEHPDNPVTYVEVPEPRWVRLVPHEPNNKARAHLWGYFIAYLAWVPRARKAARRLHEETPFDVAYHATYSAYWIPSAATALPIPSVWGPVGGAVTTPARMWPALGPRGIFWEVFELLAVKVISLLPTTRRTWRRATVPIVQNRSTLRRLPSDVRRRAVIMNHVMFAEIGQSKPIKREPFVLFANNFESRKGVHIALHAVARTPNHIRLILVGDGPERKAVERLIKRLGIEHRVDQRGFIPYDDVQELFATAGAVLFTGVREEGGLALAETMLRGAPVVVLSNGGAQTIAESAPDASRIALIEPGSLDQIADDMAAAITDFIERPPIRVGPNLDPEHARYELQRIVAEVAGFEVAPSGSPDPQVAYVS